MTLKKLIKNVLICKECQESFYGKYCFDVHACSKLQTLKFEYKFEIFRKSHARTGNYQRNWIKIC